jgi:hypothetical protein
MEVKNMKERLTLLTDDGELSFQDEDGYFTNIIFKTFGMAQTTASIRVNTELLIMMMKAINGIKPL